MKRNILIALVLLTLPLSAAFGQKPLKFAHIDTQALLASMPERDSAAAKLKSIEQEFMDQLDQLQVELNRKSNDYAQKREKLTPALREAKEKELQELYQRLQEQQQAVQRDYQEMQARLMQPIIDKANKAIAEVGEENGFIYVFDKSAGGILYASSESVDVLPLVQKKLGITPKK